MRSSPQGFAKVERFHENLRTLVLAAVDSDDNTRDEIALKAKISRDNLDAVLEQKQITPTQATTILGGLANGSSTLSLSIGIAADFTAAPTLTGTTTEGETLTLVAPSEGTGSVNTVRRWERSFDEGTTAVVIDGATGSTYVLDEDDVGQVVRAVVTVSNLHGENTAATEWTAEIAPA